MLSVTDNGCGMDESVKKDIFEPFFTTKERKKGTGLGLSTVYGIVRQYKGNIEVDSEPGHGTTFRLYFPVYQGSAPEKSDHTAENLTVQAKETILLVEDEHPLLAMAQQMLKRLGYHVLTADSPKKAIDISRNHPEKIHLLMTDVIMPGMTGRDLADRLSGERPGIRCLYVSGYTSDVIAPQGVLENDVHFMQKPFTIKVLATKLREVLS